MIDRALTVIGIALSLIGIVMYTLFPQIDRRLAWIGFVGGLLLLGAGIGLAFLPDSNAQSFPSTVNQGAGSAYSYGQQGGVTAGTINIGPMQRHLSVADKAAMLARIPKTRKISIMVVLNDAEANNLASEIDAFLRNSGYQVDGPHGAMMWSHSGTSPKGVNIDLNKDKPNDPVQITVGINSR